MRTFVACGVFFAMAPALWAQGAPVRRHSLSMEVRLLASGSTVRSGAGSSANLGALQRGAGGGDKTSVETYSRSREAASGASYLVEVRNLATTPDTARVEWYFFGEGIRKDADDFIAATGSRDLTVPAAASEKFELDSPDFVSRHEKNLRMTKGNGTVGHAISTKKSGARMSGWMVRLLVDGQVAAVRASRPSFEAAGRDPARLAAYPRKLKLYDTPREP
jgi:hypothetical protein